MTYEYFVYNLPLFFNRKRVVCRLLQTFGDVDVDLFMPRQHSGAAYHSGLARIESKTELSIGQADFGTKYPIFIQSWICKKKTVENMNDEESEEKTCSTDFEEPEVQLMMQQSFEIESCDSIDILESARDFELVMEPLEVISCRPESVNLAMETQASINCDAYICEKCNLARCSGCKYHALYSHSIWVNHYVREPPLIQFFQFDNDLAWMTR